MYFFGTFESLSYSLPFHCVVAIVGNLSKNCIVINELDLFIENYSSSISLAFLHGRMITASKQTMVFCSVYYCTTTIFYIL